MVSQNRKNLSREVVNLFLAQFAGFIIPLLQFPYIARVLDIKSLGLYLLSQVAITIFGLVIEYGFGISATRRIATEEPEMHAKTVASVQFSKLLLTVASIPLLFAFLRLSNLHNQNLLITISITLGVFAQGFSPFWYFQGRLKTSFAIYIELFSRLMVMGAVFAFVNNSEELGKLVLIQALGAIFSTAVPTFYLYREVRFSIATFDEIKKTLIEGLNSFFYRATNSLQPNIIPAVLASISGPTTVGLFGALDRINRAVISMSNPILQAFYPFISKTIVNDNARGHRIFLLATLIVCIIAIFFSVTIFIFKDKVVNLFLGEKYLMLSSSIWLVCLIAPITSINRAISQLFYLANGWESWLNRIFLVSQIIAIASTIPYTLHFGYSGALMGILSGESILLLLLIFLPKIFTMSNRRGIHAKIGE